MDAETVKALLDMIDRKAEQMERDQVAANRSRLEFRAMVRSGAVVDQPCRAIEPRPWTTSDITEAEHYRDACRMSIQRIADKVGRSYQSVRMQLHRNRQAKKKTA